MLATKGPLSSCVPRPNILPSAIVADRGSKRQPSPKGTVSKWHSTPKRSPSPTSAQPQYPSKLRVRKPQRSKRSIV